MYVISVYDIHITAFRSTVEPRYKEVEYNKTLLKQGNVAGPNSLYFFVFLPWYNEKPDITR